MAALHVRELGDFIRDQRRAAQISLRQLAKQAGVSNPYLSQIERGLRRPSAEILQQIAKALRISAEVLYVQAGILEERQGGENVMAAVLSDESLSERQKQVVLDIYEAFCKENAVAARAAGSADTSPGADAGGSGADRTAGPEAGLTPPSNGATSTPTEGTTKRSTRKTPAASRSAAGTTGTRATRSSRTAKAAADEAGPGRPRTTGTRSPKPRTARNQPTATVTGARGGRRRITPPADAPGSGAQTSGTSAAGGASTTSAPAANNDEAANRGTPAATTPTPTPTSGSSGTAG